MRFVDVFKTAALVGLAVLTTACGSSSNNDSSDDPAAPTISLTSDRSTVTAGEEVTLNWSSTYADSCSASDGWSGSKRVNGSQSVGPLQSRTRFMLTCTGSGGSANASITIEVNAAGQLTVDLAADPQAVNPGEMSTLTWTSTMADACIASGGWSGERPTSGSENVGPISVDTTYSMDCSDGSGNALSMTTVTVRAATVSWSAPTQTVDGSALINLAGFKVHYGPKSRSYDNTIDVADSTSTRTTMTLAPGTYFFALTAYNTARPCWPSRTCDSVTTPGSLCSTISRLSCHQATSVR